jgi:hypothetical protein
VDHRWIIANFIIEQLKRNMPLNEVIDELDYDIARRGINIVSMNLVLQDHELAKKLHSLYFRD